MTEALKPIRRALISTSDKSGLEDVARRLHAAGVELVSTGGTKAAIFAAGVPVIDVSTVTGFPEIMDGRVKTLHPAIHGGLLADLDLESHRAALAAHAIAPFDLLYVNLYPFEAALASSAPFDDMIEQIDIGGPAMLRAAAKNHAHVAVCTEPDDIAAVLAELESRGGLDRALRRRLAARVFARTAAYDAAISAWMLGETGEPFPAHRAFGGRRVQTLRYGENPHQEAAFYAAANASAGIAAARLIQGKELSYNNIADADAALALAAEFDPARAPAIVIVKHANPCGVALGPDLASAFARALACDPVSAFGGIVAANRPLDAAAAEAIAAIFTEVVIAPDADEAAKAVFARKKNLRLLLTGGLPDPAAPGIEFRAITGGLLAQTRDVARVVDADLKIVTRRAPTPAERADMLFAFTIAKHVKSNAIVYAKDGQTAGVGAGQMNRKDSARIAALRAREAAAAAGWPEPLTKGSACASDAFFPFADGLLQAIEAGATAVIQPGGSIRDPEVIAAADEAGIAMAFTGVRCFRH